MRRSTPSGANRAMKSSAPCCACLPRAITTAPRARAAFRCANAHRSAAGHASRVGAFRAARPTMARPFGGTRRRACGKSATTMQTRSETALCLVIGSDLLTSACVLRTRRPGSEPTPVNARECAHGVVVRCDSRPESGWLHVGPAPCAVVLGPRCSLPGQYCLPCLCAHAFFTLHKCGAPRTAALGDCRAACTLAPRPARVTKHAHQDRARGCGTRAPPRSAECTARGRLARGGAQRH